MKLYRLNVTHGQGKSWHLLTVINPIIACDIKLRDVINTQVLYFLVWPPYEASKTDCYQFENVQVMMPIIREVAKFAYEKLET